VSKRIYEGLGVDAPRPFFHAFLEQSGYKAYTKKKKDTPGKDTLLMFTFGLPLSREIQESEVSSNSTIKEVGYSLGFPLIVHRHPPSKLNTRSLCNQYGVLRFSLF
jgi:hypothetical protein